MTDHQLHRDIGNLQARMDAIEKVATRQTSMLADIQRTLTEARGGWRLLMWLGGAGAALGAAIAGLVTWVARHVSW